MLNECQCDESLTWMQFIKLLFGEPILKSTGVSIIIIRNLCAENVLAFAFIQSNDNKLKNSNCQLNICKFNHNHLFYQYKIAVFKNLYQHQHEIVFGWQSKRRKQNCEITREMKWKHEREREKHFCRNILENHKRKTHKNVYQS